MNVIRSFVFIAGSLTVIVLLLVTANPIGALSSSEGASKPAPASQRHNPHYTTATQSRASAAASLIGAIGSMVPGLITNVAPLVLLFGLGALMMPALGMGAMGLLRESRRSAQDQPLGAQGGPLGALPASFASYARPLQTSPQELYYFTKRSLPGLMSGINTAGIMSGFQEVLERVSRAIENADRQYS